MKVEIHSIQSLKRRAHKPFAPGTALISIGDFGTELPPLEYKPAHILRLEFDDVTLSEIDYESSGRYAFRLFLGGSGKSDCRFCLPLLGKLRNIALPVPLWPVPQCGGGGGHQRAFLPQWD